MTDFVLHSARAAAERTQHLRRLEPAEQSARRVNGSRFTIELPMNPIETTDGHG